MFLINFLDDQTDEVMVQVCGGGGGGRGRGGR